MNAQEIYNLLDKAGVDFEVIEIDGGTRTIRFKVDKETKPTKAADLTEDQQIHAAKTMFAYGGGFAGALSEAFFKADSTNREKLLVAFDELFMRYHRWNEEDNK
jgi:hypothetical protein